MKKEKETASTFGDRISKYADYKIVKKGKSQKSEDEPREDIEDVVIDSSDEYNVEKRDKSLKLVDYKELISSC